MLDGGALDPGVLLLVGHLVTSEESALRKALLFVFARYIEIPMLRIAYAGMRGRFGFLSTNSISRLFLKHFLLHPIGSYADTAHPMPTADVLALIDDQTSAMAVGRCRCRIAHRSCSHRLETDLVIRTGTAAFTKAWPHDYRVLTREEAKQLVTECADDGLWHMVFLHCPSETGLNEYVVCNCCTDGCVPFLLNKVFGQDGFPLVRGEYVAHMAHENCVGCGECLRVCPWEARTMVDGRARVDIEKCFGCALCARACQHDAAQMVKERPQPALRTYQEKKRIGR